MKRILILLSIGVLSYMFLPSCEDMMGDYLDKAPGVDVTEDTIFSSVSQIETFIAGMYRRAMPEILPYSAIYDYETAYNKSGTSDESESASSWVSEQIWNSGSVNDENIDWVEWLWPERWKAIRMANILLDRAAEAENIDQSYLNEARGEAYFIRALSYMEMFKRYGGVPIVDKRFQLTDDFNVPRGSIEDVVDLIVSDCDQAIALLPDVASLMGRATKTAARMIKSRSLLYAASPLFNTADPYMSMTDASKNNLICYGNYDLQRWQDAADAAKAVLDGAAAGGFSLITSEGVDKNYKYACSIADNSEIILANKMAGVRPFWDSPWTHMLPAGWYGDTWWQGYSMTYNFLKNYEKKDGTPQIWSETGGDDLLVKYSELDLRFHQSVATVNTYWNDQIPVVTSYDGGDHYWSAELFCGQWITKLIPQSLTDYNDMLPNDITFRLAEAYLNYAEALNEAQGPVAEAYDAVNTIRTRSGQPDLPPGLSQSEFRERIRNERAIELFDEDHRFYDVRRWKIASDVLNGDFLAISITPNDEDNSSFSYEVWKFETRVFNERDYLMPFLRSEVLKGYLLQNPGF